MECPACGQLREITIFNKQKVWVCLNPTCSRYRIPSEPVEEK